MQWQGLVSATVMKKKKEEITQKAGITKAADCTKYDNEWSYFPVFPRVVNSFVINPWNLISQRYHQDNSTVQVDCSRVCGDYEFHSST